MVTVRYKKLSNGKFSAYFDIYSSTGEGKGKRNYEFLKIYVDKDYSDSGPGLLRMIKISKRCQKI